MASAWSKANSLWMILILLLAIGASLGLRFRKMPTQDLQTQPAKVLNVPVAAAGFVENFKEKATVNERTVSASNPAVSNTKSATTGIESTVLDRDFAAAAARPYVETYYRQHPWLKKDAFDWNQFQTVYFTAPENSIVKGYLAVFFPKSKGSGAAFTCFNVEDDAQDHIRPMAWGMVPDLTRAMKMFGRNATKSDACFASLWE